MSQHQKKQVVQEIEPWEKKVIEKHAMSIKAKFGGSIEDYEDHAEELSVFVLARKQKPSFRQASLEDRQKSVLRWILHKSWKMKVGLMSDRKRTERGMVSLSQELTEAAESGLEALESELLPSAFSEKSPVENWELVYSVTAVLNQMPSVDKQICRRLMENKKKRQIAKELKIHRSTVHIAIKRIRTLFTDEGLKDFV